MISELLLTLVSGFLSVLLSALPVIDVPSALRDSFAWFLDNVVLNVNVLVDISVLFSIMSIMISFYFFKFTFGLIFSVVKLIRG